MDQDTGAGVKAYLRDISNRINRPLAQKWAVRSVLAIAVVATGLAVTGYGFLVWGDKTASYYGSGGGITFPGPAKFRAGRLECTYWAGFEIVTKQYTFNFRSQFENALCPRWKKVR